MPDTHGSLKPVFDPLNRESYRRRCESVVPSIYLTFISIIEGIALGLLVQQLFVQPTAPSSMVDLPTQFLERAPYALSNFLSIIIVTYEYIALTLVHRYSYRLRDTVIIFTLGFCQIAPSFFLDHPNSWWTANVFFCGAGVIAYVNEANRNRKEAFEAEGIYPMTRSKLRFDLLVSISATLWCSFAVFAFSVARWEWLNGRAPKLLMLIPMVAVQVGILFWERSYITNIHKKLGLEW